MTTPIVISKVDNLPEVFTPNTMYLLRTPAGEGGPESMEMYFSTVAGDRVVPGITDAHVRRRIVEYANTDYFKSIFVVPAIYERDLLVLTKDALVYVIDSVGDGLGSTGETLYLYSQSTSSYTKLLSANRAVQWTDIIGSPVSTAAQIDQAVNNSHTHINQSVLNKLSENAAGQLVYNGKTTLNVVLVEAQW